MFIACPPMYSLFFFFFDLKGQSFLKTEGCSSMGGVAAVEYYTHNAVLNIFGRRIVRVGLTENKPLLQWFAVMKEQATQCRISGALCLVVSKLH